MKKIIGVLFLSWSIVLTASGSSNKTVTQNTTKTTKEEHTEQKKASEEKNSEAEIPEMKDWKITFPNDSWRKEYKGNDTWDLYKEGCYDYLNSTITLFINDMDAEDSMIGSKQFSSGGDTQINNLDYEINGVTCPAYSQYERTYDKRVAKVFYPLSSEKSIQFNILVKKQSITGVDPLSDEVKQIIQSIVDENGLLQTANAKKGTEETETITITDEGLSFEGTEHNIYDRFQIVVPEGWQMFESSYGSLYIIKGGESISDYETKPYISLFYHDDMDSHTSCLTSKKYQDNAADLKVNICGMECEALKYENKMVSKPEYWNYCKVFMPVSGTESISFEFIKDSSELEGMDIHDDDVRQMLISLQRSLY